LINLLCLFALSGLHAMGPLPKLLTKHSSETLRFITMDGRYAYIQKKPGVLALVSSFRSTDFISDSSFSDFIVSGSRYRQRLAIEVIPLNHTEYNLLKNHKILVVSFGQSQPKEIGTGRGAKLHLQDEWITYFDSYEKILHIQNVITQRKYKLALQSKSNPFYIPEVEMISSDTVVYTDVNEAGHAAVISYNLNTKKSTVIYKAPQNGTRIELCQNQGYLALGEFPYEGVTRGSQILQIKLSEQTNLSGYTSIYSSTDQDLGSMVCLEKSIYFIKTTNQDRKLTIKNTEAVKLDLESFKTEVKSQMGNISHILVMDERVIIPLRGDFYVLEGVSNLSNDILKSIPTKEEQLEM
jgi:hypothetical protein